MTDTIISNASTTSMTAPKIDNRLWSTHVRHLTPYVPGEQPTHPNLCKLNTNENPFAPSPQVAVAMATVLTNQAESLRLYPEPESDSLRAVMEREADFIKTNRTPGLSVGCDSVCTP